MPTYAEKDIAAIEARVTAAELVTAIATAFAKTLLDDANAGEVLTTLGVSAFVQTILNDADAAAVRSTIGAGTSSFSGAYSALTGTPTQVYLKDSASPAHYWKLTVSTLGVLGTTDAGTSVPADGIIGNQ